MKLTVKRNSKNYIGNKNHNDSKISKKSHTCEEGGVQLRISVWHLLMNFKHNNLLKNCQRRPIKKCENFNIYNVAFKKKERKKNTWRYHYFTPVFQKS